MQLKKTSFPDVWLIEHQVYEDHRGFFLELYQERKFSESGIPYKFVQENLAGSHKGVLRGLHYQIRNAQGKLVQVLVGDVFDVVVDLRQASPTFGRWLGMHLSAGSKSQLWIPPGFAHGYYVLSDWAEVAYWVTDFYAPQWERTLFWNDPKVGIKWPLVDGNAPILSEKDARGKMLQEAEIYDTRDKMPTFGGN
jgi:dTDP-4-dehydrorhamnose 3,5-epimerase